MMGVWGARTSPPQNASAAAASCASRPAAVYVRMGGHDRAPHTCIQGEGGRGRGDRGQGLELRV